MNISDDKSDTVESDRERWHQQRMTPMVRWMASFYREIEEFPDIYNENLLDRLAQRYHEAENRVRLMAQSLLKIDLLLLIILTVPQFNEGQLFGFNVKDVSFANEALLLASAAAFFFLAWQFTTARAYEAMVINISNKKSDDISWNGIYFASTYINQELALHVTTKKLLNNRAVGDRWRASEEMQEVEALPKRMVQRIMWPLLVLHIGVNLAAIWLVFFHSKIGAIFGFPVGLLAFAINVDTIVYYWRINYNEVMFETDLSG